MRSNMDILVKKALGSKKIRTSKDASNYEEIAMAVLTREVNLTQAAYALEVSSSAAYVKIFRGIMSAYKNGKILINKK